MGSMLYDQGPIAALLKRTIEQAVREGIVTKNAQAPHDIDDTSCFVKEHEKADLVIVHLDDLHCAFRSAFEYGFEPCCRRGPR
jgi:hypothetical protein